MLIPLLIAIITPLTYLHGMETTIERDWQIYKKLKTSHSCFKTYCYQSHNIDNFGDIISVAEKSRDGLLMAILIQICLPKDVSNTIGAYISESITEKYQHELIKHKYRNNRFKEKTIDYDNDDDQWDTFSRHDGTYSVVPKIATEYALWNENEITDRFSFMYNNKKYDQQLRCDKKKNILATLDTEIRAQQNKNFIFFGANYIEELTFDKPISYYCLSSDDTLLAIESPQEAGIIIQSNTKTANVIPRNLLHIDGNVSALCAAHHSPIFAAGSQTKSPDRSSLMVTALERVICLAKINAPITYVEFSPDDSRLLTCSYDLTSDRSKLYLWNTTNFEKISYIHNTECDSETKKAFFICNGKHIVTIQKNGQFNLFDGLTGESIHQKGSWWHNLCYAKDQIDLPVIIWSNKHALLISAFDHKIQIRSSNNGKHLGTILFWNQPITALGLTIDEKKIISRDDQNAYQWKLYNNQDYNDIDFIKKQANIVQLYEMLEIRKNIKISGKRKNFVKTMKKYIQNNNMVKKTS